MRIEIIEDNNDKRKFIEAIDGAFPRGLVSRDNYEEILSKICKHAVFIGADNEGQPAGYAALYANNLETRVAYISMIGVLGCMQGRHIGSQLMRKCIQVAQNNGMQFIRLEVLNANKKAIDFYHRSGFQFEDKCSADSIYLIKDIYDPELV